MDRHFNSPYLSVPDGTKPCPQSYRYGHPASYPSRMPSFFLLSGLIPVLKADSGLLDNQVIVLLHGIRNGIFLILKQVLVE